MTQEKLLDELTEQTKRVLNSTEQLKSMDLSRLMTKPNPKAWNALECIEHLNRYARFYGPEVWKRMNGSKPHVNDTKFKPGILGNRFAEMMAPKENLKRMDTFKSMNPMDTSLNLETIEEFIQHQKDVLKQLKQARNYNLNKIKTGITISNLIKLKLGDTFRVVINHNERHLIQALKAAK